MDLKRTKIIHAQNEFNTQNNNTKEHFFGGPWCYILFFYAANFLFISPFISKMCPHCVFVFLAVQDSSIGDLVTHSLTHSVSDSPFDFESRAEQSRVEQSRAEQSRAEHYNSTTIALQ